MLEQWAAFDPVQIVEKNIDPYVALKALFFDCGIHDKPVIGPARILSKILTIKKVPHTFEEYDGDHGNRRVERFQTHVLPMMSEYLEFE